jgi:hypothetical protein
VLVRVTDAKTRSTTSGGTCRQGRQMGKQASRMAGRHREKQR